MSVAIDASMIVALLNPADVWHDQAHALQIALRKNNLELVYFDCVLAEAISVASRRLREKGRSAEVADLLVRLDKLVSSDRITWILPEVPQLYSDVLKQIVESSGELNFNDVLIALAC